MNVAYFTIYGYDGDIENRTVTGYPTMAIYPYYIDGRHPLSYLSAPVQWDMVNFINYLASLCTMKDTRNGLEFMLGGIGKSGSYHTLVLKRNLGKSEVETLADLLYTDKVLDFLRHHVTFKEIIDET